ncbi:hypothetical protein RF11_03310 [Thelohanellus kitauei]|uniref:Uncharacterized protein n=1 Tax=Thelohanellus kitauei TaxID=669202 RepID=A0A0C2MFG1_THEKT|nr:hypothetical protein RF11_03310 [Thelohanellus kitauei]
MRLPSTIHHVCHGRILRSQCKNEAVLTPSTWTFSVDSSLIPYLEHPPHSHQAERTVEVEKNKFEQIGTTADYQRDTNTYIVKRKDSLGVRDSSLDFSKNISM